MGEVATTAITTLSEVKAALLRHDASDELANEVFSDGGDFEDEGISGIQAASGEIRDYLVRDLYVSEWTPLLASDDWKKVKRTPDSDYPYQLRLHRVPDWPVLKVSEDVKIHERREIYAQDMDFSTITLWAGYRREDQNLNDLGLTSEFSDKSDIPTYPDKIVQVAKRIAIFYATQKVKGLIGIASERHLMGEWSTEARKMETDRNYVQNQLKTIQSHRSLG